jgi:hypothetical protein
MVNSKTYDLLKQARELLAQAEAAAIDEHEWAAAQSLVRAQDYTEKAWQQTVEYQTELAAELVRSWSLEGV